MFPLFDQEYDYLEELDAEYLSFSVAGCNSTEIELQRFTMTDDNLLKTAIDRDRGEFCIVITADPVEGLPVELVECHDFTPDTSWHFDNGFFRLEIATPKVDFENVVEVKEDFCLTVWEEMNEPLVISHCDFSAMQEFEFQTFFIYICLIAALLQIVTLSDSEVATKPKLDFAPRNN